MTEIIFDELGYFDENAIKRIKEKMECKTFMVFVVSSANYAGNHTLIIKTNYDAPEEKIKSMFLSTALKYL